LVILVFRIFNITNPMIYLAVGAALACIAIYLYYRLRRAEKTSSSQKENPYMGLRELALSMTANQLGIPYQEEVKVYGMAMDWQRDDHIITLVCYANGDTSLYFDTGGAILGGGKHQFVSNAANLFIEKANSVFF
jgi:hypothetical protein